MRRLRWPRNYQRLVNLVSLPVVMNHAFLERSEPIPPKCVKYGQLASDLSSKFSNASVNKDTSTAIKKPFLTALDKLKRLKWHKERKR
ncbi:hypothetical protein BpHYR1_036326 [Brachionus plicatilis]|uniref:Uncharacterized protein n=1 Tax=Brachionus plicatilis TaxID=10195 RepID=A0A3M7Q310_BRAPC|nr:hypothetical protein BpHYR1_036326 [Brachionus plicatilis]